MFQLNRLELFSLNRLELLLLHMLKLAERKKKNGIILTKQARNISTEQTGIVSTK